MEDLMVDNPGNIPAQTHNIRWLRHEELVTEAATNQLCYRFKDGKWMCRRWWIRKIFGYMTNSITRIYYFHVSPMINRRKSPTI
jgi:hypothetical protein